MLVGRYPANTLCRSGVGAVSERCRLDDVCVLGIAHWRTQDWSHNLGVRCLRYMRDSSNYSVLLPIFTALPYIPFR